MLSCVIPLASSVAEVIGVVTTVFGVGYMIFEWQRDKKNRHADVYGDLLSTWMTKEILSVFENLIERDALSKKMEREGASRDTALDDLDRLLAFLNLVCYLHDSDMIGEKEFQSFRYPLTRTLGNKNVTVYIEKQQQKFGNVSMYESLMGFAETLDKVEPVDTGVGLLTEEKWKAYLSNQYGGWTHTAGSVSSRVNTVCEEAGRGLDEIAEAVNGKSKYVDEIDRLFPRKSEAQKASYRTAVRHCYKAKHGVAPKN